MMEKRTFNLVVLGLVLFGMVAVQKGTLAQTPEQLPAGTRENYVTYKDMSITDEFNGSSLDTGKWGRRNTGNSTTEGFTNDASLLKMESQTQNGTQVKYVSVKGKVDNGTIKTTGIVSKASGYYGFYVTRFRYRGLNTAETASNRTIWHPSIWGGRLDNIAGVTRSTCPANFWVELDLMEWDNASNGWGSHTNARMTDSHGVRRNIIGDEKAKVKDDVDIIDDRWQTVGYEYSPNHLKLWKWSDGQWVLYSDRTVNFVNDDETVPESKYTIGTIGKKSRNPVFWLLGNIVANFVLDKINNGTNTKTMDDVAFDIDFFRYYRHTSAETLDWPWENELKNGGGTIQKDFSAINPVVDDVNLVQNHDFETGDLSSWTFGSGNAVTSTWEHEGTYAVKLTGGLTFKQVITVEPNTNYTLSAYGYVNSSSHLGKLGVKNYGGDPVTTNITSTSYQKYSVDFKTGNQTTAQIYVYIANAGDVVRVDDFVVLKNLDKEVVVSKSSIKMMDAQLYPNPMTNGLLTIKLPENAGATDIAIFGIDGKVVYQRLMVKNTVNVSTDQFEKGMYIVAFKNDQGYSTQKLMVR